MTLVIVDGVQIRCKPIVSYVLVIRATLYRSKYGALVRSIRANDCRDWKGEIDSGSIRQAFKSWEADVPQIWGSYLALHK